MPLKEFTFLDVYRRNAEFFPDRTAFVFEGQRITHREYLKRVERLGAGLAREGVKSGDRVAILSQNSLEMIDMIGAVARLGAILLPVNFRLNVEEIGYVLADGAPVLVVAGAEYQEIIAALKPSLPSVRSYFGIGKHTAPFAPLANLAASDASMSDVNFSADDGFVIIHTAAVGGRPRDALLSQANLLMWDRGAIGYDKLFLATGASPRPIKVPGAGLKNVFYLRDLGHAAALREALGRADCRTVAIVGGGVIGLEVGSAAIARGKQVIVVEAAARPMARVASPAVTNHVTRKLKAEGVAFIFNTRVEGTLGRNGRATGLRLVSGAHVPADIVVAGIGALPNVGLAVQAGLGCDGGIVVDGAMLTTDPHVYAVGDCARAVNPFFGAPIRIETIHNAMSQALVAAAHICGKPLPPAAPPRFWSDLKGMKVQGLGIAAGYDRLQESTSEDDDAGEIRLFSGDRLVAAETVNLPTRQAELAKALRPV